MLSPSSHRCWYGKSKAWGWPGVSLELAGTGDQQRRIHILLAGLPTVGGQAPSQINVKPNTAMNEIPIEDRSTISPPPRHEDGSLYGTKNLTPKPLPLMNSIAFIGNYPPRCCGIATFTHDLRSSLLATNPGLKADVVMVSDKPADYDYPREVRIVLSERNRADYRRVGLTINRLGVHCVSVQHEFGIYGGPDGAWIIDLLQALRVPVVTTCHTLLKEPTSGQRQVLRQIGRASAHMVVMAEKGRELLRDVFGVPDRKISVIPHGIPDHMLDPRSREMRRRRLGWTGRSVLLTFGLLSPNKGLEHGIRALPEIVRHHPDALYVVVGATHPNLLREQGEGYREGLLLLAAELGVADHLRFINRFVSRDELVGLIDAADIYLTPYQNEAQITSGTLAYAYGMGKPVISTPYWHAAELLGDGAGVLVPFNSSDALGHAATTLLGDPERRERLSQRARERGQMMTWPNIGQAYVNVLTRAASPSSDFIPASIGRGRLAATPAEPQGDSDFPARPPALSHLQKISGKHGIFQHARITKPDPFHGFCVDDNARALIFLTSLSRNGFSRTPAMDLLADRCLDSLFQSFNPRLWRFRNFMDVNGIWLEQAGSEDSHGRALWAIGHFLSSAPPTSMRAPLAALFLKGCARVAEFSAPRAWAFALLGLHGYREIWPESRMPRALQQMLSERLMHHYRRCAGPGWAWFEDVVAYDNGKLPQALLATYRQAGRKELLWAGLSSLEFLVQAQTTGAGHFRPVGCQGFWRRGHVPARFDQQPLEAQAMVAACLEARGATGEEFWWTTARRLHNWFHGANDLGLAVADADTGGCHDGLQEEGLNLNQGAESTLAYLHATLDLEQEARYARGGGDVAPAGPFCGGPSPALTSTNFAA